MTPGRSSHSRRRRPHQRQTRQEIALGSILSAEAWHCARTSFSSTARSTQVIGAASPNVSRLNLVCVIYAISRLVISVCVKCRRKV